MLLLKPAETSSIIHSSLLKCKPDICTFCVNVMCQSISLPQLLYTTVQLCEQRHFKKRELEEKRVGFHAIRFDRIEEQTTIYGNVDLPSVNSGLLAFYCTRFR